MLIVDRVEKSYPKGGIMSEQKVIQNVSLQCKAGECLGIIGESGSGKSTLGRLILGIEKPDCGEVLWEENNISKRKVRLDNMSAVFQNYTSSINPFFTIEQAIMEPLKNRRHSHKITPNYVDQLLTQVGLNPAYKVKYPHELSGGEVQRVCIARAISTEPKCIVLDEAISSLDISVQLQVLELLKSLKKMCEMSYIFITHDIQAAAYICDRIIIFRDGQIEEMVEIGQLKNVRSPYAKKLLRSLIMF